MNHCRMSMGLLAVTILCVAVGGCSDSRPKTVRVDGKVTLNGGDWPGPGIVAFRPVAAAEGYMLRPGNAQFGRDGVFSPSTFENGDGLVPGEYEVYIVYEEPNPNQNLPPKRLIEGHDRLAISPEDSGPVAYTFDVVEGGKKASP